MDAKDIKAELKCAREAIRKKEFKEALKHCKAVLAHDKNNYNALVFIGVAAEGMEQPDQAVKAYKRAIEASPDQVLAWQGLCSFYEKNPSSENDSDLVNVYQKLQELYDAANDKDKRDETLRKLAQLDVRIGAPEMATHIYSTLVEGEQDETKKLKYRKELIDILLLNKNFSDADLYLNTCDAIFEVSDVQLDNIEVVLQAYIDIAIKKFSTEKVTSVCKMFHEKFQEVVYPLETLILIRMDSSIVSFDIPEDTEFNDFVNTLQKLSSNSSVLKAAEGFKCLHDKDFLKARNIFRQALEEMKRVVCVHFYHAMSQLRLHDYQGAEISCKTCLNILQKKDRFLTANVAEVSMAVKLLQARVLYGTGTKQSLDTASSLLTQITDDRLVNQVRVMSGYVQIKMGNLAAVKEFIDKDPQTSDMIALSGWLEFYRCNYGDAIERIQKAVEMDSACSEYNLMLARSLWEKWKEEKDKTTGELCYRSLLKAAKLDPYNSDTFLYLGHFYTELQKDQMKSRKCYQKSFDLNPNNDEAGAALCDLLTASGQNEEAYQLLISVTSQASAGCAKWAWLRLGLYQIDHDSLSAAISSFQSALRADPKDNHVWECLAEGYQHRGSYTAALKAFTKAAELNPDSMYCLFQIAAIKQTLGEYTEAIEEYKQILNREPNYVPALKGLGETYLLLARSHLSKYFNGRARDNCQDALMYLTRAVSYRPDLSCLWKLMGDACTVIHPLPSQQFSMTVPVKLIQKTAQSSDMCSLDLFHTLELGARCYGKAVNILPECASLWHDLGVNIFHQSRHSSNNTASKMAEKSMNCLKKALSLDSSNYKHWNALGVVACSKIVDEPKLAQHCFIKSIQTEANNVVAWTNLATLYLKHENIQLAHEAFKVAQSLEPSYVACWIGQALIAETVGDEDAMDLFRHTTELSTHIESSVGYAQWVCSVLQDESKRSSDIYSYAIQQMAAIPAASDALARYLDRVKTDATAYNMYGMLLEHQCLYRSAATAYKSAIDIIKSDMEHYSEDKLVKVRINYARVLCHLDNYDEALLQYQTLGDQLTTMEDVCNLALTYYQSGQFKESYQAYTKALDLCRTDEDKSHVLSALGMVAYKFGDIEGAKSMLLQSNIRYNLQNWRKYRAMPTTVTVDHESQGYFNAFHSHLSGSQLSSPSVHGLQALCSLGILQSDSTLTMAVLQELFTHGDQNSQPNIVHLMAMSTCLLENNWRGACNYIQQCIHKDPCQASLWRLLSLVLLRHCPESAEAAASCAKSSLILDSNSQDGGTLITSGQLRAGLHRNKDRNNDALVSAQSAIHLYPDSLKNWYNLSAAVHSQAVLETEKEKSAALCNVGSEIVKWLQRNVGTKQQDDLLQIWCQKQRVISLIFNNRHEEAREVLNEIVKCNKQDTEEIVTVMTDLIDNNMSELQQKLPLLTDKSFCIQILAEVIGLKWDSSKLEELYQTKGLPDMTVVTKETCLLHLFRAFHAYKYLLRDDDEAMSSMFNDSVTAVLKYNPYCSSVKLMQAALNLESNTRLAKRYLLQVNDEKYIHPSNGYDVSVARRCLMYILMAGKKETNMDLIQNILQEASAVEDHLFLQYYQQITDGSTCK